jgi:hypothetical protein
MVCGCFNAFDRFDLTRCELAIDTLAEEVDESDDSIERSTKLVRDIRQKFALHAIDAEQFGREPLEFLGAFDETASLTAFVTKEER